jgi:hypothetical protein
MKIQEKTIETVSFAVNVLKRDIEDGKCGLISMCMHKVAIERALRNLDPKGGDHRTKVDGGKIRFNLNGYRWESMSPKILKTTLIQFDRERKARVKAEQAGLKFQSKVNPVNYRVEAIRKKESPSIHARASGTNQRSASAPRSRGETG